MLAHTPDPNHPSNGKLIAFVALSRALPDPGQLRRFESGNGTGGPEILEIDGKQNPNIVGFVHDQDAGAMKVLRAAGGW